MGLNHEQPIVVFAEKSPSLERPQHMQSIIGRKGIGVAKINCGQTSSATHDLSSTQLFVGGNEMQDDEGIIKRQSVCYAHHIS